MAAERMVRLGFSNVANYEGSADEWFQNKANE